MSNNNKYQKAKTLVQDYFTAIETAASDEVAGVLERDDGDDY